uniref:Uncharacterized protein n=1 Tax=Rhizophora mucronata TaxID=61149 RepID=A0A2P2MLQ2_RHIMU
MYIKIKYLNGDLNALHNTPMSSNESFPFTF